MEKFIGRSYELQKLHELDDFKRAKIVVVKGRRRTGKSRLVAEYAKNKLFLSFTGIAMMPGIGAEEQRNEFSKQLAMQCKIPEVTYSDWTNAFYALSDCIGNLPTVILLDEISWMECKDPLFVPKLKTWWDLVLSKKKNVVLFFCSSVSTWIENNIIKSTSFFGRITLVLTLDPLSLAECAVFLKEQGFKGGSYEKYKLLSVLGGIPWYLEQVKSSYLSDKNIQLLCFEKNGILIDEFNLIFNDLFNGGSVSYKKILQALNEGSKTLSAIRKEINFSHSGTLSDMMDNLITSGFITKHAQWSLKTLAERKQSLYRLSSPYTRFYLKYIEPNYNKIIQGYYKDLELFELQNFEIIFAFQVESLLLQNREVLLKALGVKPSECLFDGPWRQTATARTKGCQIDYLVQTKTNNIFVCEFKFNLKMLDVNVIEEVAHKMDALVMPRGLAIVPVLFHLGELSEAFVKKDFFYRIINIQNFFGINYL